MTNLNTNNLRLGEKMKLTSIIIELMDPFRVKTLSDVARGPLARLIRPGVENYTERWNDFVKNTANDATNLKDFIQTNQRLYDNRIVHGDLSDDMLTYALQTVRKEHEHLEHKDILDYTTN